MKSIHIFSVIIAFILCLGYTEQNHGIIADSVIGAGQMPNIVKDNTDNLHLVYGKADSIMYSFSSDHGKRFSSPSLIAVLPELFSFSMRGPQIATVGNTVIVIACNKSGNIFPFIKDRSGKWLQTSKVNDVDASAKEGLMALHAEGKNAFAVWIDLRDKHNKIYGAKSTDVGKTWSKNIMIYASPDNSVCECCKPSVAVHGNNVYVMFRNWLKGNRDLYLIRSSDGGRTFGNAQKLGLGSWELNGCPMDGGGLVINRNNIPQTVWRRQNKIFACEPGKTEKEIGEGKSCTLESVNGKNVYVWTENGEVVILKSQGMKMNLGKGQLPIIRAIDKDHFVCVWEKEKQIHTAIVEL